MKNNNTTDSNGCYVANVIINILKISNKGKMFLLNTEV